MAAASLWGRKRFPIRVGRHQMNEELMERCYPAPILLAALVLAVAQAGAPTEQSPQPVANADRPPVETPADLAAQAELSLIQGIARAITQASGKLYSANYARRNGRIVIEVGLVPEDEEKGRVLVVIDAETGQAVSTTCLDDQNGESAMRSKVPKPDWEGFEDVVVWKRPSWSDPAELRLSRERASEGQRSLKVRFRKAGDSRVAVARATPLDLSKYRRMLFDVFAENEGAEVSVALTVGRSRRHYESKTFTLEAGWNMGIEIDLTSATFKCEDSDWLNVVKVPLLVMVKECILLLRAAPDPCPMYIDNIRFADRLNEKVPGAESPKEVFVIVKEETASEEKDNHEE